jgi:hypothetical protein
LTRIWSICCGTTDQPLVVLARIAGAARERLGGHGARNFRVRKVAHVAQRLARLDIPIFHEYRLQLERDRAAQPDVELFVGETGLERRVDQVLRARVGDTSVDHRELAVVAQIDASSPTPEETYAHRFPGQYARRQKSRQHSAECRARSERVGKQAADDTAVDCTGEGLDDAQRRGVVGHDVEQQVHVVARHVDVGHQAIDRSVVLRKNLGGVAAENRQAAEVFGQSHRVVERRSQLRMEDVGVAPESLVSRLGKRHELSVSLDAPGW